MSQCVKCHRALAVARLSKILSAIMSLGREMVRDVVHLLLAASGYGSFAFFHGVARACATAHFFLNQLGLVSSKCCSPVVVKGRVLRRPAGACRIHKLLIYNVSDRQLGPPVVILFHARARAYVRAYVGAFSVRSHDRRHEQTSWYPPYPLLSTLP
jgi:hypothetical protein